MALQVLQKITAAGTKPTFNAVSASDTMLPADRLFLVVKNASGAAITATVVTPGNLPTGDAYPDKVYTVAATTGEAWIPLLDLYADPATGLATVNYSATASVTAAYVGI